MNKKTLVTIFACIIIIFFGIILWQYVALRGKNNNSIAIPIVSDTTNKNPSEPSNTKVVSPKPQVFPKVTAPAKDQEALTDNFTFEIPLSKIVNKKWQWVKAINYDDSAFIPQKSNAFSLTFKSDGTFTGTTDCNSIFGKYTVKNSTITLSAIGQTMMYCEGSEEVKFTTYLGQVRGFKSNGEENLVLTLEYDSGSMIFK